VEINALLCIMCFFVKRQSFCVGKYGSLEQIRAVEEIRNPQGTALRTAVCCSTAGCCSVMQFVSVCCSVEALFIICKEIVHCSTDEENAHKHPPTHTYTHTHIHTHTHTHTRTHTHTHHQWCSPKEPSMSGFYSGTLFCWREFLVFMYLCMFF